MRQLRLCSRFRQLRSLAIRTFSSDLKLNDPNALNATIETTNNNLSQATSNDYIYKPINISTTEKINIPTSEIPIDVPGYESLLETIKSIKNHPDPSSRFLFGFTCNICSKRHYKSISKVAYNTGLVLIECDGCNNRHLIKDNIDWFKYSH